MEPKIDPPPKKKTYILIIVGKLLWMEAILQHQGPSKYCNPQNPENWRGPGFQPSTVRSAFFGGFGFFRWSRKQERLMKIAGTTPVVQDFLREPSHRLQRGARNELARGPFANLNLQRKPYTETPKSSPKGASNGALRPKYHNINGIWTLKPYYLGPWTFRATLNP